MSEICLWVHTTSGCPPDLLHVNWYRYPFGFALCNSSASLSQRQHSLWPRANFRSQKVTIGDGAFINVGFYHDGCGDLYIGNNISIGSYVRIITGTHETGRRGVDAQRM